MDPEDANLLSYSQNLNTSRHVFEPDTRHLFVHNNKPFISSTDNTTGMEQKLDHSNKFIDIFDKNARQQPIRISAPPKNLMGDIIKNNSLIKNVLDDKRNDINDTKILPPKLNLSKSMCNSTELLTSCSRSISQGPDGQAPNGQKYYINLPHNPFSPKTSFVINKTNYEDINNKNVEKTTYCRPIVNLFNQEYVYKTMQRNARLQKLVRRLVEARQKEKQKEAWNNYINDLKNKHKYYSNEPRKISPQYVPGDPILSNSQIIDDCYNTQFDYKESTLCENLLEDLYENNENQNTLFNHPYQAFSYIKRPRFSCTPYATEHFCYPTSSQSRLIMMDRERQRNNYANQLLHKPPGRYLYGKATVVDKDYQSTAKHHFLSPYSQIDRNLVENKKNKLIKKSKLPLPTLTSTDVPLPLVDEEDDSNVEGVLEGTVKRGNTKEKFNEVTKNVATLKKKHMTSEKDFKISSLASIEGKIDNLVKSVNMLMLEMKETRNNYCRNSKSASISCKFSKHSNNNLNMTKSETYGMIRTEEILCGVVQTNSKNLTLSELASSKVRRRESETIKIDKIIIEELDKSNKIKKDIEELLKVSDTPCSVHITFDIPTREGPETGAPKSSFKEIGTKINSCELSSGDRCKNIYANTVDNTHLDKITEITSSLDNTKLEPVKTELVAGYGTHYPNNIPRMAIAVNTDPLSLLTLLRMSTDSIKQVLSFIPNLNYFSLLQLPVNNCVATYICNICGAAFDRPSQLSDHISQHNLGGTRDCCVCRHVLDMPRHRAGHFACQYCGQRFTRAYCCELHQQTCAKHFGKVHDVPSSRMLLR